MFVIRTVGLALLLVATVLFWNDTAVLGAVTGAVMLLFVTASYLVEVSYSRALERAFAHTHR
ncbi:hypothetical protein [Microbacterium sp. SSM24]|uniref:hypothetical protein n=1 Tax=Microbacterium sp. SSM24 TaxID=2991714 RepID=UPI002226C0BA|nr:hypothetical protein [Microbacterium sp. SSM24]MCW3493507.1 hypothetical protein [Microbacterium sp. SSM24]